jgi:hypothetical protein
MCCWTAALPPAWCWLLLESTCCCASSPSARWIKRAARQHQAQCQQECTNNSDECLHTLLPCCTHLERPSEGSR